MKFKIILLMFIVIITFTFCDSDSDSVVGSVEDIEIDNVSFIVDSTYEESSKLYATGRVTNLGTKDILSPWYVEAQFYTNSTYSTKLGGNSKEIKVPLEPYQSTFWTRTFTSSTVDVNLYPNFRVSDLRAIYKE